MNIYDIDDGSRADLLDELARRLREGEVGILPTETVYGLMCAATNDTGRQRIIAMKRRDSRKKLQLLIESIEDLERLRIAVTPELKCLSDNFWPGPLTIVAADDSGHEIGIRLPNQTLLRDLIKAISTPLIATSANSAGEDPAAAAANDFKSLAHQPDFWLRGGAMTGRPSTVIRLTSDDVEVLRHGAIAFDKILEKLAETA